MEPEAVVIKKSKYKGVLKKKDGSFLPAPIMLIIVPAAVLLLLCWQDIKCFAQMVMEYINHGL